MPVPREKFSPSSSVPHNYARAALIHVEVCAELAHVSDLKSLIDRYCGSVRPYADALVGFKYLYTRTSVKGNWGSGSIASSTKLDDWTLSYGAGGGVQILLYQERSQRQKKRPLHILLDVRLRCMRGSTADYLTRGSIRWENGQVVYDIRRSRTHMMWTELGVTFRF